VHSVGGNVDHVWDYLGAVVACVASLVAATADWLVKIAPALAWPLAAVVIIGWFRKEIRELIPKLIRWRAGPFEGEFKPPQEAPAPPPAASLGVPTPSMPTTAADPAAIKPIDHAIERSVDVEFFRAKFTEELALVHPDLQSPLLLLRLAEARTAGAYEWGLNQIYGSQLRGLRELEKGGGVASQRDAETLFAEYAPKYSEIYRGGFPGWLGFLEGQGFIVIEGERRDIIRLTDRGRAFLRYADIRHPGIFKPF
jgi:hypothetical protein